MALQPGTAALAKGLYHAISCQPATAPGHDVLDELIVRAIDDGLHMLQHGANLSLGRSSPFAPPPGHRADGGPSGL
jgi:hypothetical protein